MKYDDTDVVKVIVARANIYNFLTSKGNARRAKADGYIVEEHFHPKEERARLRSIAKRMSEKEKEKTGFISADINRSTIHVTELGFKVYFCMFYLHKDIVYLTPDKHNEIRKDCEKE